MIHYKEGYCYQLVKTYKVQTSVCPPDSIKTDYIGLTQSGLLTIKKGYAWDGPSGPAIDTPNFMRGSLVHDALYQLLRLGLLTPDYRKLADEELRRICKEDGMSAVRAWWVYTAVRVGGASSAEADNDNPILTAP